MSDSNRRKRPSARVAAGCIVAVVVVFLASLAVWYGSTEVSKYEREASENYSEYSAHTYGPKRNACLKLPFLSQPDCMANAEREAREYERQEQDLVSQRVTAIWTTLMGEAAITGMLLSVLGVYLIWNTFRETKRNADAAMRATDIAAQGIELTKATLIAQQRPWIAIDMQPYGPLKYRATGEIDISFNLVIRNTGPTAAIDVHVSHDFINVAGRGHEEFLEEFIRKELEHAAAGERKMQTIRPDMMLQLKGQAHVGKEISELPRSGDGKAFMPTGFFCVTYRSLFSNDVFYSAIAGTMGMAVSQDFVGRDTDIPPGWFDLTGGGRIT